MSTQLAFHPHSQHEDLRARRAELAALRETLATRESEVADLRFTLRSFEGLYLRQVGVLYAELDEWEARIAEREVSLYDSTDARERAHAARRRATETRNAASTEAAEEEPFEPTPDIKRLFREVARRIHPDFSQDASEQAHFTRLMALANRAYRHADTEALQRILDDHHELAATPEDDTASEILRIARQITHALRDIASLDEELRALPSGEISQLKHEADAARLEGRDLLAELAASLQLRVADARYRFEFADRQIAAHGR